MDAKAFTNLSTEEIARLVQASGSKVCVFPINGTRRWFVLEYPDEAMTGSMEAYLRIAGERHIELYQMFFEHGVDTLVTPIFGPDLLERGEEYAQLAIQGLHWFAESSAFLEFCDAYDVRVHVYGDAKRYFQNTSFASTLDVFDELARRTASHHRHRLFLGVCAHDATEPVVEFAVRFQQEHGRLPDKQQIIESYYGEYVEPVSFFIGFDRFTVFDMPLIATGDEDLYFTVSPSPYLGPPTLRAILYDHLYARRVGETDYADLSAEDWQVLEDFYALNRQSVLGLGRQHTSGDFWFPVPQVKLLPSMQYRIDHDAH